MLTNDEGSSSILHQQISSSRRKRELQEFPHTKKLRSRISRRKRRQISPIPTGLFNHPLSDDKLLHEFPALPAGSSSSSCYPGEISCASNWFSVVSKSLRSKKSRSSLKKEDAKTRRSRAGNDVEDARNCRPSVRSSRDENRRMTRLYLKQKENVRDPRKKENGDIGAELSESSCVDSFSGAEARVFCKSNDVLSIRNLKGRQYRKIVEQLEECEGTAASAEASVSEVSYVQQQNNITRVRDSKSGKTDGKTSKLETEDITELQQYEFTDTSFFAPVPEKIFQNICQSIAEISEKTSTVTESSISETSRINHAEPEMLAKNSDSLAEQKPEDFDLDYSLACSECLSYEEDSENSRGHETKLSEFESVIFPGSFDIDSSDFSALLTDSPSDFSEKYSEKSTSPVYFPLFLQYTKQFCRLSSPRDVGAPEKDHDKYFDEFTSLRFEDEEHEESYKKFRSRERKVIVHDYAAVYRTTTEFGDLILQQRLLMINWIVEQSKSGELHGETIFLAVSLLDRFLNEGFFKNKRKVELLGVACLTLATRIEENQPLNCVRQKAFHVGSNVYSRSEVIAMEWLVQKVLDFQFFLPTTYDFLWFYLKAARADAEVEKRTKYLAFMSLLDHQRLCYWPSTVAAGLVILASLAADQDSYCQRVMETHVRTKNDDLSECIKSLEWLVKYVC